jgi:trehalose 6-phosphate synthase/phosphatase
LIKKNGYAVVQSSIKRFYAMPLNSAKIIITILLLLFPPNLYIMSPLTAEKVADYLPLSGKMPDISGRIINVTHQIPYQISRHDVHPPPAGAPISKLNRNHQRRGTLRAHFRAAEWSIVQSRGHGALNAGLQRLGEDYDTLHIGWAGVEDLNDDDKTKIQDLLYEKGKIVPIFLDAKQKRGHYEGYCKEILWPLLHYLVDGSDGRIEKKYWADYKAVNQAFADTVAAHYRPGDISKCGAWRGGAYLVM